MNLDEIQKLIGVNFKDNSLLFEALTHKSYAMENNLNRYNERLEFLGDSILSMVVSEYLFRRFPDLEESDLSKMKSVFVSRVQLFKWAKKLHLDKCVFLSSAEMNNGGNKKVSILANCFESLLGAIYLDSGYQAVKEFMINNFLSKEKFPVKNLDFKTHLQELTQKLYKTTPVYKVVKESGPDHNKEFVVEVYLRTEKLGRGTGKSKKEAEQKAAKAAIKRFKDGVRVL